VNLPSGTLLSRAHEVLIRYQPPRDPRVWVRDALETRERKALPHTFVGGLLCLYEDDEWRPTMSIAHMIVP